MVKRELIHNFIKKKYISCDNLKSIIEKEELYFKYIIWIILTNRPMIQNKNMEHNEAIIQAKWKWSTKGSIDHVNDFNHFDSFGEHPFRVVISNVSQPFPGNISWRFRRMASIDRILRRSREIDEFHESAMRISESMAKKAGGREGWSSKSRAVDPTNGTALPGKFRIWEINGNRSIISFAYRRNPCKTGLRYWRLFCFRSGGFILSARKRFSTWQEKISVFLLFLLFFSFNGYYWYKWMDHLWKSTKSCYHYLDKIIIKFLEINKFKRIFHLLFSSKKSCSIFVLKKNLSI